MTTSARLSFARVTLDDLDAFHSLVVDEHIRRYLMDGAIVPRDWSRDRITDSDALFARRDVGLWLVYECASTNLIGFCGFLELPSAHQEPQLVYAMLERFTGRGYATEMARATIEHARTAAGFTDIHAAVDEPNQQSWRVLEKLGFTRTDVTPGAFGRMFGYRLSA